METALIRTDTSDSEVIHRLVDALDKDARSLGPDDASRCVCTSVRALRTAIETRAGTVAAALRALEANVERLHMNHMQPFFKQTLRTLRTELGMDVKDPVRPPSAPAHPRSYNSNGSFSQNRR
jgi:hypothetical protein